MKKQEMSFNESALIIFKIICSTGELPYRCLSLLEDSRYTIQRTARSLMEDEYLKGIVTQNKVQINGEWKSYTNTSLVLSKQKQQVKETVEKEIPGVCDLYKLYVYDTYQGAKKTLHSAMKRDRSIKRAHTFCFMYAAGVKVFLPDKPDLVINRKIYDFIQPVYYPAPEIKQHFVPEARRTMLARSSGYLICNQTAFAVYNLNMGLIKVGDASERGTNDRIQLMLNAVFKSTHNVKRVSITNALILANDYQLLEELLTYTPEKKKNSLLMVNTLYDKFYFLPVNKMGVEHLKLLLHRNGEILLKKIAYGSYRPDEIYGIDADAYDGKTYSLCFFVPDLSKLFRFREGIYLYKNRGTAFEIKCFSYQADAVYEYIGDLATIKVYDFYEVRNYFADITG